MDYGSKSMNTEQKKFKKVVKARKKRVMRVARDIARQKSIYKWVDVTKVKK